MKSKPALHNPSKADFAEIIQHAKIKRYTRQQSAGAPVAALEQLHARLVEDAQLYESDDLQDQRDAVADSLLAVVDFLKAQGFAAATLSTLMRPVAALAERENNSLDLMFAQRARGGRPKSTLADHERTGILAALAEGWLRAREGDSRPQPLKLAEASRKMKGKWFGSVTRAQLETARELVNQEASDHPAVQHFQLFCSFFDTTAETFGIESAFDIMVQWLNSTSTPFGFGQRGILKTSAVSPTEDN
jgi:hypothetical protein